MEKLVPKVWVLVPGNDQDRRYFYGSCPDLMPNGTLKANVVVEILPLGTHPYHNGVFIDTPFWYAGAEVSYGPRRLFFENLGFVLKRKHELYDHVVLKTLYGTTEKHLGAKTLAIIFPNETILEDEEAENIIHTIRRSFVSDCQTAKGRSDEKLSCIESVYLITPHNAAGEARVAHQLMDALLKEAQPA